MNVRLDEFLILTRASYIFNILKQKNTTFINSDGEPTPLTNLDLVVSKTPMQVTDLPEVTLLNLYSNLEFIFQCCIEGVTIDKYLICRTDKTMENILILNFPHTRKDNNEVINVQIPLIITKTDVLVVSPFNAPEIAERFNSENEYVISLLKTYDVYGLDVNNKPEIIKYAMTKENDKSVEAHIIDVLDAVATSIHMQTEYFIKDLSTIQDTNFNTITEDSKEFKAIYGKYGKEIDPESTDEIPLTAYTPIIIKDLSVNKSLIKKTSVTDSSVVQNIVGIESFEEVNESSPLEVREILIRCPELTKPVVFKLPDDLYYVDYNEVVSNNDADVKSFRFLDTSAISTVNSDYVPNADYSLNIVGTESVSKVINKVNEKLLIPFKQFGVVKGTKIYELIKPVLNLPVSIVKKILGIIFSMFKTNSKLEKEKSIELREKLLNDELDTTMTKLDLLFGKYSLLIGSAFFVGGYITAIIVYFIFKNRETNVRRKALERTERQVVSKIREYEKKIEFATQESDYPAVKKLSHTRDSYKAMLDKLREVKKEALGKADKFTDTYSEYND